MPRLSNPLRARMVCLDRHLIIPKEFNMTSLSPKYRLLRDESITVNGHKLYRIQALRDFGNVKKGDKGGFVESEYNLSHKGDCWVGDDGRVFEYACVFSDAQVFGNAQVSGNAKIYWNAFISDNAKVSGHAEVSGNAHIFNDARVCLMMMRWLVIARTFQATRSLKIMRV
ncbi:hypothetical protein [Bartonella sp. DGB2]|uniref:hypothetical protein n=1 Tax=Bartonella sp. DGB2 TaxID=3388426 RepID=UPI00398FE95F